MRNDPACSTPSPCGARRAAFTLTELLILVAMMGALAAIVLPAMAMARARARNLACMNNLKSLGFAYAACWQEAGGALPAVYYQFSGMGPSWTVALRTGTAEPDVFFEHAYGRSLRCAHDPAPVSVMARDSQRRALPTPSSYAYNLALPILYQNASRVATPVNTAVFYDGDASAVVGPWTYSDSWAAGTVRARHKGWAGYVYLDGHVDSRKEFDASLFACAGKPLPAPPTTLPVVTTTRAPTTTTCAPSTTTRSSTTSTVTSTTTTTLPGWITGMISINKKRSFSVTTPTGTITKDNLDCERFTYTGPASSITVTPADSSGWVKIDSTVIKLQNHAAYTITGTNMQVRISFQSGVNWVIEILGGTNGAVR